MRINAVVLVFALCACATSQGVVPQVRHEQVLFDGEVALTGWEIDRTRDVYTSQLGATSEQVFQALPVAFAELKMDVTESNPKAGQLSARRLNVRGSFDGARMSTFFDCGQSAMGRTADRYALGLRVASAVRASTPSQTTLSLQASATARPDDGGMAVPCSSTGVLEKRLQARVAKQLGEPAVKL